MSMYYGEHSIRFYPNETVVGAYAFDGADNPETSGLLNRGQILCPNTWKTWHLIPTKKPVFKPPEMDFEFTKILGRQGKPNIAANMPGAPYFGNRNGSIEFILDPDYFSHWHGIYSDVLRYFHGQERLAVLNDDRYFFYKGWFSVGDWSPDSYWDTLTLNYNLDPYKYERWDGTTTWRWDDFDFECGIIRDTAAYTKTIAANSTVSFTIRPREKAVPVQIKTNKAAGVALRLSYTRNGSQYTDNYSAIKTNWVVTKCIPNVFEDSSWTLSVKNASESSADVSIRYRGAEL